MKQFLHTIIFLIGFFVSVTTLYGQHGELIFIENKGQWADDVQYAADFSGGKLFVSSTTLHFVNHDSEYLQDTHLLGHEANVKQSARSYNDAQTHEVKVHFDGADKLADLSVSQETGTLYNYYIGNDSSHWAASCKGYKELTINDLYKNIKVKLYSDGTHLKYDFVVAPGGDYRKIALKYEGVDVKQNGEQISYKTSFNEIHEAIPLAYQTGFFKERKEVTCDYKVGENLIKFDIKSRLNKKDTLVIDPILIFSTYSGSTADNWGFTATFDDAGNVYSGGIIFGQGLTSANGSFEGGQIDAAILKYDSTGSKLLYMTYVGGLGSDAPHSLVVNSQNELLVLGTTGSNNLPTTANSYQQNFAGGSTFVENGLTYSFGSDLFIAKLSPSGAVVGITYLGGSLDDGVMRVFDKLVNNYGDQFRGEIVVDDLDNVYIASNTKSTDFPTVSSYQNVYQGGQIDAIIAKFNPDLSDLIWSTYFGGSAEDAAFSLKLDKEYNVFFTGGTASTDLPTSEGALHENALGGNDPYVAHLYHTGDSLISCTYTGTSTFDQAYFVELDTEENVYLLGQTNGFYPIVGDVYKNNGSGQFIHKLSYDLTQTLMSTVFGSGRGLPDISPTAFLVNECGNIYVSGWGSPQGNFQPPSGNTSNLPVTNDAYLKTSDGSDFYLMVLQKDAKSLMYATYFGGQSPVAEHVDGGTSRFDKRGIVYQSVCADCRASGNSFPTTPGAWSNTNNSPNCNNAVFKFDLASLTAILETNSWDFDLAGLNKGCFPLEIAFINKSIGGIAYFWDFGNGEKSENTVLDTVYVTYEQAGVYPVTLTAIDANTCKAVDIARTTINVFEGIFEGPADQTICLGEQATLSPSGGAQHIWTVNDLVVSLSPNPVFSPDTTTMYNLHAFDINGCEFFDSVTVNVIPAIVYKIDPVRTNICEGSYEVHFVNNTTGSSEFFWNFGDGTTSNEFSPTHKYTSGDSTVNYTVTVQAFEDSIQCYPPEKIEVNFVELFVPNVFTPGTPPQNETFQVITDSHVNLTVVDRWGSQVYSQDNYQNDWTGGDLAAGVYYYELEYSSGDVCKGWVQIMR